MIGRAREGKELEQSARVTRNNSSAEKDGSSARRLWSMFNTGTKVLFFTLRQTSRRRSMKHGSRWSFSGLKLQITWRSWSPKPKTNQDGFRRQAPMAQKIFFAEMKKIRRRVTDDASPSHGVELDVLLGLEPGAHRGAGITPANEFPIKLCASLPLRASYSSRIKSLLPPADIHSRLLANPLLSRRKRLCVFRATPRNQHRHVVSI